MTGASLTPARLHGTTVGHHGTPKAENAAGIIHYVSNNDSHHLFAEASCVVICDRFVMS